MAINLLSPGVKITEADLTASVTATGTTVGGIAGNFVWGPTNEPTLVFSESDLVAKFGKPSTTTNVDFLSAANYLAYSPNLYVVRAVDTSAAKNAASDSANAALVENLDDYENSTLTNVGQWIAKYPGAIGNSLKVSICGNTSSFATWSEGNTVFDFAPGTSPWATAKGLSGANDEVHILVIDEDGKITGVANTILEKFPALSKASDARSQDGGSNYYKTVINTKSKYIWWAGHPTGSDWGTASNTSYTTPEAASSSLAGGADGTVDEGDYVTAYQKFTNKQNVTISVLPVSNSNTTVVDAAIAVAEARKDAMVCFSPERDDVVNAAGSEVTNVKAYADSVTRSTYAIMDSNWKYQYDKYNDVYVYVPCAADVAGCLARVDGTKAPWFSPAGYTQGRILNAVKLAWNPTQSDRDSLYKYGINPIFTQPGRGTILFGDKTFTTTTGSFSRVNVRRLFIQIESAIEGLAGDILFEQNDSATRERFVNAVEPYLRTVQGGRGIEQFKVVCDTTNNTDDIVTSNGFVADIFIRPIGSINFIQLNFVSVAGAAAFAALG